ncbi:MAG: hypothetical protein ACUZ8E_17195 [Candidatus Anammoxibacter sp.]
MTYRKEVLQSNWPLTAKLLYYNKTICNPLFAVLTGTIIVNVTCHLAWFCGNILVEL